MGLHEFFGQLPGWTFVDVAGAGAAYTAKPGEYVLVDASNGAVTITLSTGTSGVKKIDPSANPVTIVAAAGNTLGSLGATMFPLRLPDQALVATVRGTNHAITHGYQSLQQLDTRFARAAVPAAAGAGRAGRYDPQRTIYTPATANMQTLRGHLGRASARPSGTPDLVDMVCAGDSRTAGTAHNPANSYPSQLRARLAAAGIPSAGTGLVMASLGVGFADSRLVLAGTWTHNVPARAWGATGSTATFTTDVAGTVVEVYYTLGSGTFTVKVGSATAVTVTPAAGTGIAKYTVSTSVAAGTAIVVTSTSAAGNLIGFCVRGTSGLLIHSVAVTGWTTGQWAANSGLVVQQVVNTLNPSIMAVMLGCNDPAASTSYTPPQTAANLATILTTNNPTSAKVLLAQTPTPAYAASWPDYMAVLYNAADTYGLPLIDLNDRYGTPDQATAAGLLGSDKLHETVAGCADIARAVTSLLAA